MYKRDFRSLSSACLQTSILCCKFLFTRIMYQCNCP